MINTSLHLSIRLSHKSKKNIVISVTTLSTSIISPSFQTQGVILIHVCKRSCHFIQSRRLLTKMTFTQTPLSVACCLHTILTQYRQSCRPSDACNSLRMQVLMHFGKKYCITTALHQYTLWIKQNYEVRINNKKRPPPLKNDKNASQNVQTFLVQDIFPVRGR